MSAATQCEASSKAGASDPAAIKAQVLDRIRALAPKFRERAHAAEQARKLPAESAQELIDAGIIRILIPPRFGGYGFGVDTWFDVVREISKADASHGWCASLLTHHPHYLGQFQEEAQQEVWAGGPDVPIAASIIPAAQATPVDGGYRLSGHSPFASGIGHSRWVFIGALVEQPGGPPQWTLFLVRPDEYTVVDTWFTAGMCATGSNTIVTDNVFVPKHRTLRLSEMVEGKGPGGAVNDNPIFRAPLVTYAPLCFVAPMLGAAQGAYEYFRDWTRTRKGARGIMIAELASTQLRMARVAADLDAAELLLRRAVDLCPTIKPSSLDLRARALRDFSRATEISVEAIDTLIAMSGTAGFAASNPIQRAWRDIHFASMHVSLNFENNFTHFGRLEFGLPRDPHLPFY
jgi:3-hydroxy-9,10-secoandrosta-1,3,5(10)-triene-9,17-dione monooxygenase